MVTTDLSDRQLEALRSLNKAAIRLELARGELRAALSDHEREKQRAIQLCPYLIQPHQCANNDDD